MMNDEDGCGLILQKAQTQTRHCSSRSKLQFGQATCCQVVCKLDVLYDLDYLIQYFTEQMVSTIPAKSHHALSKLKVKTSRLVTPTSNSTRNARNIKRSGHSVVQASQIPPVSRTREPYSLNQPSHFQTLTMNEVVISITQTERGGPGEMRRRGRKERPFLPSGTCAEPPQENRGRLQRERERERAGLVKCVKASQIGDGTASSFLALRSWVREYFLNRSTINKIITTQLGN